jgi:hypothetical protein
VRSHHTITNTIVDSVSNNKTATYATTTLRGHFNDKNMEEGRTVYEAGSTVTASHQEHVRYIFSAKYYW